LVYTCVVFVFQIAAIGLIAAGAYVQLELKDYFDLIEGQFSSAAALLIAVGVIIFFIASFGCCGAFKENYMCVMIVSIGELRVCYDRK
jgi:CD63 antigen